MDRAGGVLIQAGNLAAIVNSQCRDEIRALFAFDVRLEARARKATEDRLNAIIRAAVAIASGGDERQNRAD